MPDYSSCPSVSCTVEFRNPEQGGRRTLPTDLESGVYRPHVVVSGPSGGSEYLGVAFVAGVTPMPVGRPLQVTLALLYHPNVSYAALVPGAHFRIMEGPNEVGTGSVTAASPAVA
jgi:hypothetical protein